MHRAAHSSCSNTRWIYGKLKKGKVADEGGEGGYGTLVGLLIRRGQTRRALPPGQQKKERSLMAFAKGETLAIDICQYRLT